MRIALSCVVVLWCLLTPARADACTCVEGIPPCQSVWQATSVVEATIASIETVTGPPVFENGPRYPERLVRLQDVRAWVGESTDVVITGMGGGDCGYAFRVGTRYLIATHKRPDGHAVTGICSGTQPAESAGPLKSYLETLSQPSPGAKISGNILLLPAALQRSAIRNEPLAGVRLLLTGPVQRTVQSGTDGTFAFERLPAGQYTLSAQLPPGRTDLASIKPQTFTIPNAQACAALTLTTSAGGLIEGTVVDTAGRPIRGAVIDLRLADVLGAERPAYESTRTDETGAFRFDRLAEDRYVAGINIDRGPTSTSPFAPTYGRLVSGATPEIIDLRSGGRQILSPIVVHALAPVAVAGRVQFEDGTPAANAGISFIGTGEQRGYIPTVGKRSDELGKFTLELFEGVAYVLQAGTPGFVGSIEVKIGTTPDPLVITLKPRRD